MWYDLYSILFLNDLIDILRKLYFNKNNFAYEFSRSDFFARSVLYTIIKSKGNWSKTQKSIINIQFNQSLNLRPSVYFIDLVHIISLLLMYMRSWIHIYFTSISNVNMTDSNLIHYFLY